MPPASDKPASDKPASDKRGCRFCAKLERPKQCAAGVMITSAAGTSLETEFEDSEQKLTSHVTIWCWVCHRVSVNVGIEDPGIENPGTKNPNIKTTETERTAAAVHRIARNRHKQAFTHKRQFKRQLSCSQAKRI
jgi:hypothetical protein